MQKKIFSILLTLCMVLAMAPTVTFAANEGLKVIDVGPDSTVNVASGNTYEITKSGIYRVSNVNPNEATSATIKIAYNSGKVILILDGVNIEAPDNTPAIEIDANSSATDLPTIVNGKGKTNTLKGGGTCAGIQHTSQLTNLTITCENALNSKNSINDDHMCDETECGTLNVTGGSDKGKGGAGIGGSNTTNLQNSGTITISNCTINVKGGLNSAGIGPAAGGTPAKIELIHSKMKIEGGAQGQDKPGSAIGGTSHNEETQILIINCDIIAIGGKGTTNYSSAIQPAADIIGCVWTSDRIDGSNLNLQKENDNGYYDDGVFEKQYVKIAPHKYWWTKIDKPQENQQFAEKCTVCGSVNQWKNIQSTETVTGAKVSNKNNLSEGYINTLTESEIDNKLTMQDDIPSGSLTMALNVADLKNVASDKTVQLVEEWKKQQNTTNWITGKNLDFELTKKFGQDTDASRVMTIATTVQITYTIPDNLKGKKAYKILGLDANGKIKEYADIDKDPNTYTIETDIFGTYVFVYEEEAPAPTPGSITTTVEGAKSAEDALEDTVLKDIPSEEKEKVENGKDLDILLKVKELQNASEDTTVKLASNWLKSNSSWKTGQYLDFNLTWQIEGEKENRLYSTKDKVKVTLTIPENLRGKKGYKLLALKDGKIVEYNDLDKDANTITIETDVFSTYILVYEEEQPNIPVKAPIQTTSKKYPTGKNPIPSLFALLIAASSIGIIASLSRKKSNKR